MQSVVLTVSLVLMAVVAFLFWRAVAASSRKPSEGSGAGLRTPLIWGLAIIGVFVALGTLREWPHAVASEGLVVKVTGGQWYWEIDTQELPLGQPVTFHVTSQDVNHGMGVYNADKRLIFQAQGMPGYVNKISYTFDEPGTYQVLCMEFCGLAHHNMMHEFTVVAGE